MKLCQECEKNEVDPGTFNELLGLCPVCWQRQTLCIRRLTAEELSKIDVRLRALDRKG